MIFKLKKEAPGFYKVIVNNFNRFNIRKRKLKSEPGEAFDWTVHDLTYKKKYIDFVSLKEAKDFIKNEIFS